MTETAKKATHGGRRAGAGRKPANPDDGRRVEISATVSPLVAQYLADASNRSQAIDKLVRGSSDFRRWLVVAKAEGVAVKARKPASA